MRHSLRSIARHEQATSVEDRTVPSSWEGDLIDVSRNSYVAALVERHSRYVMPVKVATRIPKASSRRSSRTAATAQRTLPVVDMGQRQSGRRSSAPDIRGRLSTSVILASLGSAGQRKHQQIAVPVSSACHRYSLYSQAKLSAIARQLNERPRKTLLYQTRAEEFVECVTAIRCPHRAFSRNNRFLAHALLKTGTMDLP
jgi:hypothetical protein